MSSISSKFALLQLVCASLVAVILYVSMDRQLLPQLTESFVTRSEVVTEGLAASVESSLVARDITSAQAAIDQVLSIPDVKWAYITAPNGEVLADTFVPQFPDQLKRKLSGGERLCLDPAGRRACPHAGDPEKSAERHRGYGLGRIQPGEFAVRRFAVWNAPSFPGSSLSC